MRLLVSVRSVEEVDAAMAGWADIIDVKEPARGAMGAASPEVIRAIAEHLPDDVPLSVALGDPMSGPEAAGAARVLTPSRRSGEVILKLGLAGAQTEVRAEGLLGAVRTAVREAGPAGIVAVAYADWASARAPIPSAVIRVAAATGMTGVLLDTFVKDGRDLFAAMQPDDVAGWIREARAAGLVVAVAGSIGPVGIARLRSPGPDVVGVRGAACDGGRMGRISEARVRALRAALGDAAKRETLTPLGTP